MKLLCCWYLILMLAGIPLPPASGRGPTQPPPQGRSVADDDRPPVLDVDEDRPLRGFRGMDVLFG